MIDIGRNDRAPAGDLVAHEFGRDEFRNRSAKALAVFYARGRFIEGALAAEIFAMRDIAHLLGDDAGAGEFELRHGRAARSAVDFALGGAGRNEMAAAGEAIVLGLDRAPFVGPQTGARRQPGPGDGQSGLEIGRKFRAAVRA